MCRIAGNALWNRHEASRAAINERIEQIADELGFTDAGLWTAMTVGCNG
jgi:hypothetical protein